LQVVKKEMATIDTTRCGKIK